MNSLHKIFTIKVTKKTGEHISGDIVQHPHVEKAMREKFYPEPETVNVCPWCYNEAYQSRIDGVDMCRECGCIEDVGTKEITLAEWLEEHG